MSNDHSPLGSNCDGMLSAFDCYATEERGAVGIFDCEGEHLFSVTPGIAQADLRTMLVIHGRRFDAGYARGKGDAFASLRALIGVDEAITKAREANS